MEIRDFCTKDTPEREKIGGHRGGCLDKKGNKKRAIATNCYSPLGCHYLQDIMRVLFQTGAYTGLNLPHAREKPATSPENFCHLAGEGCQCKRETTYCEEHTKDV